MKDELPFREGTCAPIGADKVPLKTIRRKYPTGDILINPMIDTLWLIVRY
jgi:hypothetical protein